MTTLYLLFGYEAENIDDGVRVLGFYDTREEVRLAEREAINSGKYSTVFWDVYRKEQNLY
jgi:hypothetical protein